MLRRGGGAAAVGHVGQRTGRTGATEQHGRDRHALDVRGVRHRQRREQVARHRRVVLLRRRAQLLGGALQTLVAYAVARHLVRHVAQRTCTRMSADGRDAPSCAQSAARRTDSASTMALARSLLGLATTVTAGSSMK